MGGRGFAPMPTQLKILQGMRPDRINHSEPVPSSLEPDAPADLTPEALEIWHFTVDELRSMRILHRCDRDTLVAYVEAVKVHREASRVLANSPLLITGQKGNLVRNPVLAIQRDAADLLRKLAAEFGLTPSARSRIVTEEARIVEQHDGNPFAGTALEQRYTPQVGGEYVDDGLDDALDEQPVPAPSAPRTPVSGPQDTR